MSENNTPTETTETPELSEELITINDRHFHKNTLNDEQIAAFEQAVAISNKIEVKREEARDLSYARQYLIGFIEEGIEGYTEYFPATPETPETPEAEAETAETTSEVA